MLARLHAIPGVTAASVEASGHVFHVEVAAGAPATVEADVVAALGGGARRLSLDEATPELAARARGERWFGAADLLALTLIEGRMIVARVTADVARALGLDEAQAERLAAATRDETFALLERMHAEALPGGHFFEAWPGAAARIAERCAPRGADREALREAIVGRCRLR